MKLADVSINRPVFATVMMLALVVFGISTYFRMQVDLFPDIAFPVVTVTAIYPGSDPETIESKVVDKIEEAVNQISGVDTLRSSSSESVGYVVIQFKLEKDPAEAVQEVRDKVAAIEKDLPKDLDPPVVARFDMNALPIINVAIFGDLNIGELTRLAKDVVKARLQTVNGVGRVDIIGGQEREFKVWVQPEKLDSYGLSINALMGALASQNIEIPAGQINTGKRELSVKTKGQVADVEELGNIIITSMNGAVIRVSDVARVEDGVEEKRSHSDIDGKSAITLQITKQSDANTVEVSKDIKQALEELKKELPKNIEISIPTDNSRWIVESITGVQEDLLLGAILAVIIVFFFLRNWRATLVSALALPTSIIGTFAFMKISGFTFNVVSMLALSLSIGMLIDDAIVVIENIFRHLEAGKPPLKAASEAVEEIGLAVLATTLSIVAVFLPVAMMQGIIGRIFVQFGFTVVFAVIISLFVAFTLTPMLSSRVFKTAHSGGQNIILQYAEKALNWLDRNYRTLLASALKNRAITLSVAVAVFIVSLFLMRFIPTEFHPEEDRGEFKVAVEMPTGTSLEATREYIEKVAKEVRGMPGVKYTFTSIGGGVSAEINKGTIMVYTVDRKERKYSQLEFMAFIREKYKDVKGALISVEQAESMGGGSKAVTVQYDVMGRDYKTLEKAVNDLTQTMQKSGGFVDIDTSYRVGKPEIAVIIDRDRAADLGVSMATVAMALRTFLAGDTATDITVDSIKYDVRVQVEDEFRKTPENILKLRVPSMSGELVAMSNIISLKDSSGPAKIDRRNRQKCITVYSNLEGKVLGQATSEIEKDSAAMFPEGITGKWTGQAYIMQDSFKQMFQALLFAVILVYLILAAQFESFIQPFIIMLSLPLSLVGAIGTLLALKMTLSMYSMIGIIMLMGLVTKNAILLIDYTNTLRGRGMGINDALLAAGPVRLRPILMTTLAMIFGMLPVALALSAGGEGRAPMAVAVIGGLVTSTLLTLVVVPVAYSIIENIRAKSRKTTS